MKVKQRIGMFEDFVGDLQPILAGVSKSIKSATLEDDDDAPASLAAEMDDAESNDTVEVAESLTDVETTETDEVLANARLKAWSSHQYPDIEAVGSDEHADVPFTAETVEAAVVGLLAEEPPGVDLECVADLDELDAKIPERYQEAIYRLTLPEEISVEHPPEPGTVAYAITQDEHAVAVTFDGVTVMEYPSIQFLLLGDPLFAALVSATRTSQELDLEWMQVGFESADDSADCVEGADPAVVVRTSQGIGTEYDINWGTQ